MSSCLFTIANLCRVETARSSPAPVPGLRQLLALHENQLATAVSRVGLAGSEYRLHAVLVHAGEAGSGHYWVYIHDQRSDRWYKFNDTYVTHVSIMEVYESSYGGDGLKSAYALVYIKNDSTENRESGPGAGFAASDVDWRYVAEPVRTFVEDDNNILYREQQAWSERQAFQDAPPLVTAPPVPARGHHEAPPSQQQQPFQQQQFEPQPPPQAQDHMEQHPHPQQQHGGDPAPSATHHGEPPAQLIQFPRTHVELQAALLQIREAASSPYLDMRIARLVWVNGRPRAQVVLASQTFVVPAMHALGRAHSPGLAVMVVATLCFRQFNALRSRT